MNKMLICALAASCALAISADTVLFKSGSRLEGEVVGMTGGEVVFNSTDVGEVKIAKEKIASLESAKVNVVEFNDLSRKEGTIAVKDGAYIFEGNPLDMSTVKAVNPAAETWHGSAKLTAVAQRGNTRSEKVSFLADAHRRWEKDRFTSNFGYYFAQSGTDRDNKKKTEDRVELAAQEDHFWSTSVYSYINGKYERDGINLLQYRHRIGLGMGYQWLDGYNDDLTGKWSFNQEAGLTYIKEKYEHIDADDRMTFRYAHHLSWNPSWSDRFAFTHNLEYLPDTDNWAENYLIDADAGFTYALIGAWQLFGLIEWDYNSNPGPNTKSSDFRYTLGLAYSW